MLPQVPARLAQHEFAGVGLAGQLQCHRLRVTQTGKAVAQCFDGFLKPVLEWYPKSGESQEIERLLLCPSLDKAKFAVIPKALEHAHDVPHVLRRLG